MKPARVYLDYNASAPIRPEVSAAVLRTMQTAGNPSSIHAEGQRLRTLVERARGQVAALIGCSASEIVFTSGATESNNIAIRTLAGCGGAILSTPIEHPSVRAPLDNIRVQGRPVVWVPVDSVGQLAPTALVELGERQGARSVSIMLANNEVGTLLPVAEVARGAHERGWWVHCDAAQAVGKIPVDVVALDVDLLSLSGHKFGGPRGVGALFVRRGIELSPLMVGGHQERGRRSGTENVAAIVGLGVAAELARRWLDADRTRVAALRDRLWEAIALCDPTAVRQGDVSRCLPNTLNVRFDGLSAETLAMGFDLEGVAVSAGSACSSGSLEPSHVLLAMGIPYSAARGSIRFSLGPATHPDEIDLVVAKLQTILARMRRRG